MIDFYDVSLWQDPKTVGKLVKKNGDRILAVKVSEGANIKDGKAAKHIEQTNDSIECYILYHYMRCDINSKNILPEVDNFLAAAKKTGLSKAVLALDFERPNSNSANASHVAALQTAIFEIEKRTGSAPYVYINESECRTLKKSFSPAWLWVAKWSKYKPAIECGLWQYTNRADGMNIDRNHFLPDDISLLKRHEVNL